MKFNLKLLFVIVLDIIWLLVENKNFKPTKEIDLPIYTLISKKSYLHAIFSQFSFKLVCNAVFPIVFFDDGTTKKWQKKLIKTIFKKVTFIDYKKSISKWNKKNNSLKLSKKFRFNQKITPVRKKLDIFLFPLHEQFLYIDTDVLFFSIPKKILRRFQEKKSLSSLYTARIFEGNDMEQSIRTLLKDVKKLKTNSTYNSGLLYFSRKISQKKVEKAIKYLTEIKYVENSWLAEETAMYLACDDWELLSPKKYINVSTEEEYQISLKSSTKKSIVSVHYSSDQGLKDRFFFDFCKKHILNRNLV